MRARVSSSFILIGRAAVAAVVAVVAVAAITAASTALAGIPFQQTPDWISTDTDDVSTGGALVDLDRDGWLDLVVANGNDMARQPLVVYYNRGAVYYYRKQYDKSWDDIKKAQDLGYKIPAEFLDDLRKASGRQN